MGSAATTIILDGSSLTIPALARLARDPGARVACDPAALERVQRCREHVLSIVDDYVRALAENRPPPRVYGVTTGFGEFKNRNISPEDFAQAQRNLLLSHAVGVGDTTDEYDSANYFSAEVIRAVLVLRLNAFLKGHSGVSVELVRTLEALINHGIIPLVPTRGSVGSSGDLCPLAHLFGILLGQGRFYVVRSRTEAAARTPPAWLDATALSRHLGGAAVMPPGIKEGLALTNGATFCAAQLALAVSDAEPLAATADIGAAMCLEALGGRTRGLDPRVHAARNMSGQAVSAANIAAMLDGSSQVDRSADVQDAYSLRCAPAVHGASRDAIAYARMIVEQELNAATDNPLFFPDGDPPFDRRHFSANQPAAYADQQAYSAGNFHGQPLGLAADFLAIALAEFANISERRTQMLLDEHHNRNLPANLTPLRGLNSGLMIAQYAAAGLVSENKVLSHPASVDSIPTSANVEDHVAMASIAARKLRTVLGNAQAVLAIELLTAAAALEWRVGMRRPCEATPKAGTNLDATGTPSPEDRDLAAARAEQAEFERAVTPAGREKIAQALGRGTAAAYRAVRRWAAPVTADRVFEPDVRRVRAAVESGEIAAAVNAALEFPLPGVVPLRSG